MGDPILVLQMQRMGDLILSFPLLMWLARRFPGRPLHVVAEEAFFKPLLPLSPHAGYISWPQAQAGALSGIRHSMVVNLSIREEAARLAGSVEAEVKFGPVREADGALRVRGAWQLYRASLVRMGRHNRFHWADLNALDVAEPEAMAATRYDPPRAPDAKRRAVGLFLGASEDAKRPGPVFWAGLARALLDRGIRPVLLGGPGDQALAQAVMDESGLKLSNLTGQLRLSELADFGKSLDLFITPDTGPMHLAAWTGLPALNISVGPVNPWDTGPYQPGHLVLRAAASCARGCWDCLRGGHPCHAGGLAPGPVAALASQYLRSGEHGGDEGRKRLERMALPGLELYETCRTAEGLFSLRRMGPALERPLAADLAGEFWRRYFLGLLRAESPEPAREAWAALATAWPKLAGSLGKSLPGLGRGVAALAASHGGGGGSASGLAARAPQFWWPLASYLEMDGQNRDLSPQWAEQSLARLADLARLLS